MYQPWSPSSLSTQKIKESCWTAKPLTLRYFQTGKEGRGKVCTQSRINPQTEIGSKLYQQLAINNQHDRLQARSHLVLTAPKISGFCFHECINNNRDRHNTQNM